MANKVMNDVRILHDVRSKETWEAFSTVIPMGYLCIEEDDEKYRLKIGNGEDRYSDLPYVGSEIDIDQVDAEIEKYIGKMGTLFIIKGRKDTFEDLPIEGNKAGDVWLVGLETDDKLNEYYWRSDGKWDWMGHPDNIDLSEYYTGEYVEENFINKADTLVLNCKLT